MTHELPSGGRDRIPTSGLQKATDSSNQAHDSTSRNSSGNLDDGLDCSAETLQSDGIPDELLNPFACVNDEDYHKFVEHRYATIYK